MTCALRKLTFFTGLRLCFMMIPKTGSGRGGMDLESRVKFPYIHESRIFFFRFHESRS